MQIHLYKNNGYNMILDVPGGSVHVADELMYEAAALMAETGDEEQVRQELLHRFCPASGTDPGNVTATPEEIDEVLEELRTLKEEGSLFSEEPYAPSVEAFAARPTVVKALCLHIAHDCNLACRYCFAEEGEYHGRRALMSFETGKKALDFLIASSGARTNLEVDFFGGEPLMNWEVVKKLVAYGLSVLRSRPTGSCLTMR